MVTKLRTIALLLATSTTLAAQSIPQPTSASTATKRDTSYIDAQGTAYVTRVVPVPPDLSPEARKSLIRTTPDQAPPESLEHRRAQMELSAVRANAAWSKLCPNSITDSTLAGVPVRIVTPSNLSAANQDKVLIDLHGGGFNADSGSYAETIPIAGYTGIKVIAVLYRLAPEHPFPAGVDDAVAVYRELLKTYKPSHIVLYGTSAGAVLTAEVAVKLKSLGLPMPAALGIFSTLDRFDQEDDSQAIYTLQGFAGHLDPPDSGVHDPFMSAPPIRKIRCSPRSTRTCTACRRPCLSPAAGTLSSAEPQTCTAPICAPASMHVSFSSTPFLTPSGTTRTCRSPSKPTTSWRISC
jgi:epsilon-lactone hydrolase